MGCDNAKHGLLRSSLGRAGIGGSLRSCIHEKHSILAIPFGTAGAVPRGGKFLTCPGVDAVAACCNQPAGCGMLVAGGFCYGRLLDGSSVARESQNSPDSCACLRPAPQHPCSRKTSHRAIFSWQTQFAGAAHGILPCHPGRAGSPNTEASIRRLGGAGAPSSPTRSPSRRASGACSGSPPGGPDHRKSLQLPRAHGFPTVGCSN